MPTTKTKKKNSKQPSKERRPQFEVPCDCGMFADALFARLESGETDLQVKFMIWDLEEALAFLEDLPEEADIRDLDLEANFTWTAKSLKLIRERQSA